MSKTEEEKRILREIGYYFLQENLKTKDYDKSINDTYKFLNTLNITDIETVKKDHYLITMCRPGLFIGSKGSTINSISEKLKVKIDIKENIIPSFVYPTDISQYDGLCDD